MTLSAAAIAPNHLGDGVMALPALAALAEDYDLTIYAPSWGKELYAGLAAAVRDRGPIAPAHVAVLFPTSFRAAWQARRAERVIGLATDGRGVLITEAVCAARHRRQTYAQLARAAGVQALGAPRYRVGDGLTGDSTDADGTAGHVGLNPISASGEVVQWPGFAELAGRLRGPVLAYGGPGEQDVVEAAVPGVECCVGLGLAKFARSLRTCRLFISNDSGAAHFARACGVPTLVVYGSTTADRTGPDGAVAVEGPSMPCRPCYRKSCDLGRAACLDIAVDRVVDVIFQHWPEVLHG